MENSLPSLYAIGQQFREWFNMITGEQTIQRPIDMEAKLPTDYNVAAYCLSAALAFTATVVFVMAWKKSDASKRDRDETLTENDLNDLMEGSGRVEDINWSKERNVGGGEYVPWVLQEGCGPEEAAVATVEGEYKSESSTESSEGDTDDPHNSERDKKNLLDQMKENNGWFLQNLENSVKEELPWILQDSKGDDEVLTD